MGAGGSGSFGRDLPAAQIRRWAGGTRWEARSGPGAKPGPDCTGSLVGTCVGTAVPAGSSCMCAGTGVHRWCSRSSVGNACLSEREKAQLVGLDIAIQTNAQREVFQNLTFPYRGVGSGWEMGGGPPKMFTSNV